MSLEREVIDQVRSRIGPSYRMGPTNQYKEPSLVTGLCHVAWPEIIKDYPEKIQRILKYANSNGGVYLAYISGPDVEDYITMLRRENDLEVDGPTRLHRCVDEIERQEIEDIILAYQVSERLRHWFNPHAISLTGSFGAFVAGRYGIHHPDSDIDFYIFEEEDRRGLSRGASLQEEDYNLTKLVAELVLTKIYGRSIGLTPIPIKKNLGQSDGLENRDYRTGEDAGLLWKLMWVFLDTHPFYDPNGYLAEGRRRTMDWYESSKDSIRERLVSKLSGYLSPDSITDMRDFLGFVGNYISLRSLNEDIPMPEKPHPRIYERLLDRTDPEFKELLSQFYEQLPSPREIRKRLLFSPAPIDVRLRYLFSARRKIDRVERLGELPTYYHSLLVRSLGRSNKSVNPQIYRELFGFDSEEVLSEIEPLREANRELISSLE